MMTKKTTFAICLICFSLVSTIIYSRSQAVITISTFFATDDTYVSESNHELNYGNTTIFKFGKDQRAYFKFNFLVNLDTLMKAMFSLYLISDNNDTLEILVSTTNMNWNENNITWINRPLNSKPINTFNISGNIIKQYEVDLTQYINSNYISLCLFTNSLDGYGYTKEHSQLISTDDPQLTITYQNTDIEGNTLPSFNMSFIFVSLAVAILMIIHLGHLKKKIKLK